MNVVLIDLCANKSAIVFMGILFSISRVAKACRMACAPFAAMPALRKHVFIEDEKEPPLPRGLGLYKVRNTSG
jgi:hypothetical protein